MLASPEFKAALKKHYGIDDTRLVMVDIWSAGNYGSEEDRTRRLAIEVDDDNPAALRGQPPCGRGPDPARTTGHDRHFALKPAQHCSIVSRRRA